MLHPATRSSAVGNYLAGFVAAEGTFTRAIVDGGVNGPRQTFTFAIALGASDREMCELLRAFLGVGRVRWYPRRKAHYDDEVVYSVRAFRDLIDVVVPFMDEHLPPSHKRVQYEAWRTELLAYDAIRASRQGWSRRPRSA
jgi:hypothetical protein